jgi:hypothetical protein
MDDEAVWGVFNLPRLVGSGSELDTNGSPPILSVLNSPDPDDSFEFVIVVESDKYDESINHLRNGRRHRDFNKREER